jgi:hypothetical protein
MEPTRTLIKHQFLLELAEEIRNQHLKSVVNVVTPPLGQKWVQHFLKRNPTIKLQRAKSIEQARVEVTKEQVMAWFAVFKHIVTDNNVKPENIYNMDETGKPPFTSTN